MKNETTKEETFSIVLVLKNEAYNSINPNILVENDIINIKEIDYTKSYFTIAESLFYFVNGITLQSIPYKIVFIKRSTDIEYKYLTQIVKKYIDFIKTENINFLGINTDRFIECDNIDEVKNTLKNYVSNKISSLENIGKLNKCFVKFEALYPECVCNLSLDDIIKREIINNNEYNRIGIQIQANFHIGLINISQKEKEIKINEINNLEKYHKRFESLLEKIL
jgi:hypothetical protein